MRCFSCGEFSFDTICPKCINEFLVPEMIKRRVANLEVISFFDYYLISDFVKSKYHLSGYHIYKFIAKYFFQPFLQEYAKNFEHTIYLIGVDENVKRAFSNVALLTHYGAKKIKNVKALHGVLKAKNKVSYAGKSLEFRLTHPRNFFYKGAKDIEAILIDDTITTGTTLFEAQKVLISHGVKLHFALTLASAKEGMDY